MLSRTVIAWARGWLACMLMTDRLWRKVQSSEVSVEGDAFQREPAWEDVRDPRANEYKGRADA